MSKTFGEVLLVVYQEGNTRTLLMAKAQKDNQPDKELRALPVIRIHNQRHWMVNCCCRSSAMYFSQDTSEYRFQRTDTETLQKQPYPQHQRGDA